MQFNLILTSTPGAGLNLRRVIEAFGSIHKLTCDSIRRLGITTTSLRRVQTCGNNATCTKTKVKTMSTFFGLTIIRALEEARIQIDPDSAPEGFWAGDSHLQQELLELYGRLGEGVMTLPNMDGAAFCARAEAEAWLRERGFAMEVPDPGELEFLALGCQKLKLDWSETARWKVVASGSRSYAGFELDGWVHRAGDQDVAILVAKDGSRVMIAMVPEPTSPLAMIKAALGYQDQLSGEDREQAQITAPKVSVKTCPDVSVTEGLVADDPSLGTWKVLKACQMLEFDLDESGARVKEASYTQVRWLGGRSRPRVVIDRPFLVWVMQPECSVPSFVGYITYDDWEVV